MEKQLTSREKKLLKQPKYRILSMTLNEPNRAQRRAQERIRSSSTISTKKWTKGRLAPRRRLFLDLISNTQESEKKSMLKKSLDFINQKIGTLRK